MPKPSHPDIKTWYLLGREPLLSAAELFSLLGAEPVISGPFAIVSGPADRELIKRLGGTIKIAAEIADKIDENKLLDLIKKELQGLEGKIEFGISLYGKTALPQTVSDWGKMLKKELKSDGRSVRYVFKNAATLSSVSVEKNGLLKNGKEFLVVENNGLYSLALTTAVQPFEEFSERDYGRPGRDSESGMLPPKLALMMYNLTGVSKNDLFLDPFCGSGTLIAEAFLQGQKNLAGTDLSEKAIADTKENLGWISAKHPELSSDTKIEVCNVKELSTRLLPRSVGAIATEPYLGMPLRGSEPLADVEKQADELRSLYLSAFSEFKKVLKPGAGVVFIIPQFFSRSASVKISDRLVPELKKLGFLPSPLLPRSIHTGDYILYRRPGQHVGREIWRFILNG